MHLSSLPCMLHILPMLSSLDFIFSEEYKLQSLPYETFSSLILHHYPQVQINILLSVIFLNTLSLCYALRVSHQFSHSSRTTVNIIILYILTFKFLVIEKTQSVKKHFLSLTFIISEILFLQYHFQTPEICHISKDLFGTIYLFYGRFCFVLMWHDHIYVSLYIDAYIIGKHLPSIAWWDVVFSFPT